MSDREMVVTDAKIDEKPKNLNNNIRRVINNYLVREYFQVHTTIESSLCRVLRRTFTRKDGTIDSFFLAGLCNTDYKSSR